MYTQLRAAINLFLFCFAEQAQKRTCVFKHLITISFIFFKAIFSCASKNCMTNYPSWGRIWSHLNPNFHFWSSSQMTLPVFLCCPLCLNASALPLLSFPVNLFSRPASSMKTLAKTNPKLGVWLMPQSSHTSEWIFPYTEETSVTYLHHKMQHVIRVSGGGGISIGLGCKPKYIK